MSEDFTRSRLMRVGFGSGALGAALSFGAVPVLFLYYLTEFARVPPALAGALLAAPKLVDLLMDPWIGRRTDGLARRFGSRSGLLAIGMVVLPVLLVALFAPVSLLALPLRIGLLGLLLVALSLMSTVYSVAHTAIASDMAGGIGGRSALMSARAMGQTLAGLVVSVAAPQLLGLFSASHGGYVGMASVLGASALAAMAFCWIVVRRVPLAAGVERGAAPPMLRALFGSFRNKAFYCIALILVMLGASSTALLSALPYANQHLLHAGPENLSALLTPLFVTVLAGIAVAPALARRVPPPALLAASLLLALTGLACIALGPRGNAATALGTAVFGLASGALTVMISTLAIETSTRFSHAGESLGLYLGILFSAEKLGQSLGGFVVGLGLDWVGPLEAAAPPSALHRLQILWVAAPMAGLVVALLLLLPLASRWRSLAH